jgi:putative DNA primase/helicase
MQRLCPAFGTIASVAPTSAADLARYLGGKKSGARSWSCRCPAHNDANPSLSISEADDGKILVHCHAGCSQDAVLDALRNRGLSWHRRSDDHAGIAPDRGQGSHGRIRADLTAALAKKIWDEGVDPAGTVGEEYLAARRLILAPELRVLVLRFHSACAWEGGTVPALIAAFRSISDNSVTGIHRIRLDQPECWPKAERKMLGSVAGSAVKLDPTGECLIIGEGVETALAARQLGLGPVWALGSAGAIEKFQPVAGVNHLFILGENDDSGRNRKAAETCRENWKPRDVSLVVPRQEFKDINDATMRRANGKLA